MGWNLGAPFSPGVWKIWDKPSFDRDDSEESFERNTTEEGFKRIRSELFGARNKRRSITKDERRYGNK